MSSVPSFNKQPRERLDYDIDFTQFFEESDADELASVTVAEVSGPAVAPDLHIDGAATIIGNPARRVKVWLEGGVSGTSYKVSIVVATDAGRLVEQDFIVRVKER